MQAKWAWLPVVAAASLGCALAGPRHRARHAAPVIAAFASSTSAPSSASAAPPCSDATPSATPTDIALVPDPDWVPPEAAPEPAPSGDTVTPDDAASSSAPESVVPSPQLGIPAAKPPTPKPPAAKATNAQPATGPAPALEYAALEPAACAAELKKRGIPHVVEGTTNGVDLPIRLTGKLHGVDVHGLEPPAKRPTSPWEILDCRLALALDDLTALLTKHDVVELIHMSMYRPPPKGEKKHARHSAALAIDVGTLVRKDGTKLSVLGDWHGHIGAKTCGPGAAPSKPTKEALELRAILCETYDARLFNVVLTPNYNKPHANHFHLEVTRGVKWFILD